jgi:hypothetical protein
MDPDAGARQDAPALLLLDDSGRELHPSGSATTRRSSI